MRWFDSLRRERRTERSAGNRDDSTRAGGESAVIPPVGVRGDNPIRRPDEDTLGRSTTATLFARQVLALDVSEGVVVGVLGRWGSGKTSFVNLARAEFERAGASILDFNPWMLAGRTNWWSRSSSNFRRN
jgi:ABC-type glutathione transport system ATPase component